MATLNRLSIEVECASNSHLTLYRARILVIVLSRRSHYCTPLSPSSDYATFMGLSIIMKQEEIANNKLHRVNPISSGSHTSWRWCHRLQKPPTIHSHTSIHNFHLSSPLSGVIFCNVDIQCMNMRLFL